MPSISFDRARRLGAGSQIESSVVGVVAAVFPPIMILLAGMAAQVLVDPTWKNGPGDGILTRLWWPDLIEYAQNRPRAILVGLALTAAVVALLHAWIVTWLRRAAHANARRIAAELKNHVHAQAFRLGCNDALGEARSWPEQLFIDKVELVRQGLAAWGRAMPHSLVLLALLLGLAVTVHVWLTLLVLALAALVWRVDGWLRERNEARTRLHRERADIADQRLVETLNLAPLATGYSMDELPGESFADLLRQEQTAGYRSDVYESARSPWFWMIVIWSVAFVLVMIGLASRSSVAGGAVLVLSLVSGFFPLKRLARWRAARDTFERAARDIYGYLDRTPTVQPMPDAAPLEPLRRELRIENVTLLDRQGKKVLDEISLTAPALSRIAVLSTDVSTPRALAGLFPRFYDPVAGRILFDDVDIRWGTLESVRSQTLLVLRDSLYFTGTILENIGCGQREFTTDRIHDAAKQCHAIDFILGLPDGFDTIIGQHGVKLDPTQAFRIALARAVIRAPSMLVIEEPDGRASEAELSAVDAALANVGAGRTLVIAPSRLATLRSADLVILFRGGKVVAQGKHADLLQNSELYRHINYIRFNPFPEIA